MSRCHSVAYTTHSRSLVFTYKLFFIKLNCPFVLYTYVYTLLAVLIYAPACLVCIRRRTCKVLICSAIFVCLIISWAREAPGHMNMQLQC
jgi:hypothetical protein